MSLLPRALKQTIESFSKLPGVGPRSAERYTLALLKKDKHQVQMIAESIAGLHDGVAYCKKTFALTEPDEPISKLYSDPERDKTIVAVVEDAFDVVALENTDQFRGTYHVLGGLISPLDSIGPEELTIEQLATRIDEDGVKELIIATNASVEGESTALYIQKRLEDRDVKITRLARGMPVGLDLEYADIGTLSRALEGRTSL
ncbi:recombination protein RecR [Candidatus Saccharibacteria bacterium]|nr:recombination protein RecR [Candidatus Saccharibacteria bacterium]